LVTPGEVIIQIHLLETTTELPFCVVALSMNGDVNEEEDVFN